MRYPVPLESFSNEFCAVHLLMHHWNPLFQIWYGLKIKRSWIRC